MKFSHKIEYAECRILWPKLEISWLELLIFTCSPDKSNQEARSAWPRSREIKSIWKWVGPYFYLFCCCQFSFWFFELILLFPDYLNIKRPSINRQWYCYKPIVSPIRHVKVWHVIILTIQCLEINDFIGLLFCQIFVLMHFNQIQIILILNLQKFISIVFSTFTFILFSVKSWQLHRCWWRLFVSVDDYCWHYRKIFNIGDKNGQYVTNINLVQNFINEIHVINLQKLSLIF